jgi:serine/threonine-protein kinase
VGRRRPWPAGCWDGILEEVAQGAFGMVFKARDRVLGRLVAIKVFKPDLGHSSALTRFREEPQIASQLDHPGVAPVHEMGRMADGRPYVVMKGVYRSIHLNRAVASPD